MKLERVERSVDTGRVRLTGEFVRADGTHGQVYFAYEAAHAALVSDGADPFVPALLLPAMAAGEPLEIVPPVSAMLLARLPFLQAVYSSWFPRFRPIAVHATARSEAPAAPAPAVGAFFSGGVDAFYTLLKSVRGVHPNEPRITHLIFFHGLETTLAARRGGEAAEARARAVAHEAGLTCVVGETDLRTHFPLVWGDYCGAGLAAAAHSLSAGFASVRIPSTDSFADAVPYGSNPLLDGYWSTERTAIVADGGEAPRIEKLVRLVADDPLAQRHLRVCVHNDGGDFNCGHCYKCVRTMVALRALGKAQLFPTFPPSLPADLTRSLADEHEVYLRQNLTLLERTGREPALAHQVRRVLRARLRRTALRTWLETSALAAVLPGVRALRARLGRG